MHTLTITVPDDAKEFIETQVSAGKFGDPSALICHLLQEERKRRARERIEALLDEGLDSGEPSPMTAEDWAEMRRELQDFVSKRHGQ